MTVSDWVLVYAAKVGDTQLADRVRREAAWRRAFKANPHDPLLWRLEAIAFGGDDAG